MSSDSERTRGTVLHIRTRAEDPLAARMTARQHAEADRVIRVVDLTVGTPDYDALVGEIFAAESIAVW